MRETTNEFSNGFSIGRIFLRTTSVAIMIFGFKGIQNQAMFNNWLQSQYGGHFQFLTIQGLILACMTMATGLIADFVPSFRTLRLLKRVLLVAALPLSVVISSLYWSIILVSPGLLLQSNSPEILSTSSAQPVIFRIPLHLDLALHAVPALALLLDFNFYHVKYGRTESRFVAPLITCLFGFWYSWWAEHCASHNNGKFPYPFLTDNTFEVRVGIYLGASILALISFWTINGLHH